MKCEKEKQGFELCSLKKSLTYVIEMERVHMDGYGVRNLKGVVRHEKASETGRKFYMRRRRLHLKWSHSLFLSFDLINMVTIDFIFIMAMTIEIFFTMVL